MHLSIINVQAFFIISILIISKFSQAYAQCIENLMCEQTPNRILINYNYYDNNLLEYDFDYKTKIQVFCSLNGGKDYGYPLKNIYGNCGYYETFDSNKYIIWDYFDEYGEFDSDSFVIRVEATTVRPILNYIYNDFVFESGLYSIESNIYFKRERLHLNNKLNNQDSIRKDFDSLINFILNFRENNVIIKQIDLIGYNSPEGEETYIDLQDRKNQQKIAVNYLRDKLEENAIIKYRNKYNNRYDLLCKNELSLLFSINMKSEIKEEDWKEFMELVEKSDIKDKSIIRNVVDHQTDILKRHQEIRNMCVIYKEIEDDILPLLSRIKVQVKYYKHIDEADNSLINFNNFHSEKMVNNILISYDSNHMAGLINISNNYIARDDNVNGLKYLRKAMSFRNNNKVTGNTSYKVNYNDIIENNLSVLWLYSNEMDYLSNEFSYANEQGIFHIDNLRSNNCYFKSCIDDSNKIFQIYPYNTLEIRKPQYIFPNMFGKKYAIIIGISDYKNLPACKETDANEHLCDLNYGKKDAEDFCDLIMNDSLFGPDWIIDTLYNEMATYQETSDILSKRLNEAGANDMIFIYFSGHGKKSYKNIYLLNYEYKKDNITSNLNYDLWINELIKGSPANYVVMFVDACESGTIKVNTKGMEDPLYYQVLKEDEQKLIFYSSTSGQNTYEDKNLKNGVFTHFLLKGLLGEAKERNNDRYVNAGELLDYVTPKVIEFTKNKKGGIQYPNIDSYQEDYNKYLPISKRKQ